MDSLYKRGTDGARRQAEQIRNDVIPALEDRIAAAEEEQEKAETRNEIIGKYEEMARRATQLSEQRAKEEKKAADQMERQKKLAREAFNERFEGMEQYVEAQKSELQQLKEKKELWESMQFTEDQEYQLQIKEKALDLLEEEISKLERQKEEKQESKEATEGLRDIEADLLLLRTEGAQKYIDNLVRQEELTKNIKDATEDLANSVSNDLKTGFVSAFTAIGEAAVEGEDVMKSFGKSVILMFADMLKSIGAYLTSMAVAYGLATMWGRAAAATAGAAAAYVASGAVSAYAQNQYAEGGVIEEPVMGVGQKTGETYSFGERGPETVTPGRNKGQSTRITVNLDRRVILDAVSKGTQNGEVIVDQRAVR
jgi:hypothetical protein